MEVFMKVVFMGTPDFALPSLRALVENGYQVEAVVTQPDRPGGRGKKLRPPPVKIYALQKNIQVLQPEKLREPNFYRLLRDIEPDAIVVAAYGRILPARILELPRYGCINVHASLLPAYRGAAPIHRAVINGEKETGITIMQMDAGLDTGDIIIQDRVPIGLDDTTGDVHDRLAELGGELLVSALELIAGGLARPVKQDGDNSSYAHMLSGEDEIINWARDALSIKNQVRGLNPWPVARTRLRDKLLKVWRVDIQDTERKAAGKPGQVLHASANRGIIVQTGSGMVIIRELQLQGKKRMSVGEFLKGNPVSDGTELVR
jgi:methionyl-tRNA formyltransferase